MLDVPEGTIRPQRTKPAGVVRTRAHPQHTRGRDVEVGALVSLRTNPEFGIFFAFALVAQVEGVREFAARAFFAEAALVVFAD